MKVGDVMTRDVLTIGPDAPIKEAAMLMVKEGKLDPTLCKVIWKTPYYADYNFTAHPILEERYGQGFTEKLKDALLAMRGDLLQAFPRSALIDAKNEDFDAIATVARSLNLLR